MSSFSADSERYTVVVGVEDGSRVRYRPAGSESVELPEAWEKLKTLIGENMGTLDPAALTLHAHGGPSDNTRKLAVMMGADPEILDQVWDLVGRIFDGLITQELDPFDWSAVSAPLKALFGGTNPWAFRDILRILVATDIDPAFARQLIRQSPDLLLAHAGAEHERTRGAAVKFLKAVSGEDFGADVEAWTAWVNSLPQGS